MFLYVTQTNTRLLKLCLLNVKHMLNIYAHVSLYRYTKYHKCILPDIWIFENYDTLCTDHFIRYRLNTFIQEKVYWEFHHC